jgi:hypothetical protein
MSAIGSAGEFLANEKAQVKNSSTGGARIFSMPDQTRNLSFMPVSVY